MAPFEDFFSLYGGQQTQQPSQSLDLSLGGLRSLYPDWSIPDLVSRGETNPSILSEPMGSTASWNPMAEGHWRGWDYGALAGLSVLQGGTAIAGATMDIFDRAKQSFIGALSEETAPLLNRGVGDVQSQIEASDPFWLTKPIAGGLKATAEALGEYKNEFRAPTDTGSQMQDIIQDVKKGELGELGSDVFNFITEQGAEMLGAGLFGKAAGINKAWQISGGYGLQTFADTYQAQAEEGGTGLLSDVAVAATSAGIQTKLEQLGIDAWMGRGAAAALVKGKLGSSRLANASAGALVSMLVEGGEEGAQQFTQILAAELPQLGEKSGDEILNSILQRSASEVPEAALGGAIFGSVLGGFKWGVDRPGLERVASSAGSKDLEARRGGQATLATIVPDLLSETTAKERAVAQVLSMPLEEIQSLIERAEELATNPSADPDQTARMSRAAEELTKLQQIAAENAEASFQAAKDANEQAVLSEADTSAEIASSLDATQVQKLDSGVGKGIQAQVQAATDAVLQLQSVWEQAQEQVQMQQQMAGMAPGTINIEIAEAMQGAQVAFQQAAQQLGIQLSPEQLANPNSIDWQTLAFTAGVEAEARAKTAIKPVVEVIAKAVDVPQGGAIEQIVTQEAELDQAAGIEATPPVPPIEAATGAPGAITAPSVKQGKSDRQKQLQRARQARYRARKKAALAAPQAPLKSVTTLRVLRDAVALEDMAAHITGRNPRDSREQVEATELVHRLFRVGNTKALKAIAKLDSLTADEGAALLKEAGVEPTPALLAFGAQAVTPYSIYTKVVESGGTHEDGLASVAVADAWASRYEARGKGTKMEFYRRLAAGLVSGPMQSVEAQLLGGPSTQGVFWANHIGRFAQGIVRIFSHAESKGLVMVHELVHALHTNVLLPELLDEADMKALEDFVGEPLYDKYGWVAEVSDKAKEKLAVGFTTFLGTHRAPNAKLHNAFSVMKSALKTIINRFLRLTNGNIRNRTVDSYLAGEHMLTSEREVAEKAGDLERAGWSDALADVSFAEWQAYETPDWKFDWIEIDVSQYPAAVRAMYHLLNAEPVHPSVGNGARSLTDAVEQELDQATGLPAKGWLSKPLKLTAWHGTPHKFDKFSIDKIGTGEGNQSYGWGLYFAGVKEIADHYRSRLSRQRSNSIFEFNGRRFAPGGLISQIVSELNISLDYNADFWPDGFSATDIAYNTERSHSVDIEDSASRATALHVQEYLATTLDDALDDAINSWFGLPSQMGFRSIADEVIRRTEGELVRIKAATHATEARLKEARDVVKYFNRALKGVTISTEPTRGALYKVDLKPKEEEYLLWDKPLKKQSEFVKNALQNIDVFGISLPETGAYLSPVFLQSDSFSAAKMVKSALDDEVKAQAGDLLNAGERKFVVDLLFKSIKSGDEPSFKGKIELQKYPSIDIFSIAKDLFYVIKNTNLQNMTGMGLYRELAQSFNRGTYQDIAYDRKASAALREVGIRGIKYLNGASRRQGEGDYNYVIFDDADVEIMEVLKKTSDTPPSGYTMDQGRTPTPYEMRKMSGLTNNNFNGAIAEDALKGMEEVAELIGDVSREVMQPLKLTAWHGGPKKFDRFDVSQVGSSNGLAFGWGLYFADLKDVAQHYKELADKTWSTIKFFGHTATYNSYISYGWAQQHRPRLLKAAKGMGIDVVDRDVTNDFLTKDPEELPQDVRNTIAIEQLFMETVAFIDKGLPPQQLIDYLEGIEYDKKNALTWLENDIRKRFVKSLFDNTSLETEEEKGTLYKVDLKPKEEEYLLWDRPLKEQSPLIKRALDHIGVGDVVTLPHEVSPIPMKVFSAEKNKERQVRRIATTLKYFLYSKLDISDGVAQTAANLIWKSIVRGKVDLSQMHDPLTLRIIREYLSLVKESSETQTGEDIYKNLAAEMGKKKASMHMRSFGIRGIKYLNGFSRAKGEGDYNYVIFDDADVQILDVSRFASGGKLTRDQKKQLATSLANEAELAANQATQDMLLDGAPLLGSVLSEQYKEHVANAWIAGGKDAYFWGQKVDPTNPEQTKGMLRNFTFGMKSFWDNTKKGEFKRALQVALKPLAKGGLSTFQYLEGRVGSYSAPFERFLHDLGLPLVAEQYNNFYAISKLADKLVDNIPSIYDPATSTYKPIPGAKSWKNIMSDYNTMVKAFWTANRETLLQLYEEQENSPEAQEQLRKDLIKWEEGGKVGPKPKVATGPKTPKAFHDAAHRDLKLWMLANRQLELAKTVAEGKALYEARVEAWVKAGKKEADKPKPPRLPHVSPAFTQMAEATIRNIRATWGSDAIAILDRTAIELTKWENHMVLDKLLAAGMITSKEHKDMFGRGTRHIPFHRIRDAVERSGALNVRLDASMYKVLDYLKEDLSMSVEDPLNAMLRKAKAIEILTLRQHAKNEIGMKMLTTTWWRGENGYTILHKNVEITKEEFLKLQNQPGVAFSKNVKSKSLATGQVRTSTKFYKRVLFNAEDFANAKRDLIRNAIAKAKKIGRAGAGVGQEETDAAGLSDALDMNIFAFYPEEGSPRYVMFTDEDLARSVFYANNPQAVFARSIVDGWTNRLEGVQQDPKSPSLVKGIAGGAKFVLGANKAFASLITSSPKYLYNVIFRDLTPALVRSRHGLRIRDIATTFATEGWAAVFPSLREVNPEKYPVSASAGYGTGEFSGLVNAINKDGVLDAQESSWLTWGRSEMLAKASDKNATKWQRGRAKLALMNEDFKQFMAKRGLHQSPSDLFAKAKAGELKAGDYVYMASSPFKFPFALMQMIGVTLENTTRLAERRMTMIEDMSKYPRLAHLYQPDSRGTKLAGFSGNTHRRAWEAEKKKMEADPTYMPEPANMPIMYSDVEKDYSMAHVTLNFSQRGTWTHDIQSQHMFWNPMAQDFYTNMMIIAQHSKLKGALNFMLGEEKLKMAENQPQLDSKAFAWFLKAMGYVFLPTIAMAAYYGGLPDDDPDKQEWLNQSFIEKMSYFHIPIPFMDRNEDGTHTKLRIATGLGMATLFFHDLPVAAWLDATDKDPDAMRRWVTRFFDNTPLNLVINPAWAAVESMIDPNATGEELVRSAAGSILGNELINPMVELYGNYAQFPQKEIKYGTPSPLDHTEVARDRYNILTNTIAKIWPGGLQPAQASYLVKRYFPGLAGVIPSIVNNWIMEPIAGATNTMPPDVAESESPVYGQVGGVWPNWKAREPWGPGNEFVQDMYKLARAAEGQYNAYNHKPESGKPSYLAQNPLIKPDIYWDLINTKDSVTLAERARKELLQDESIPLEERKKLAMEMERTYTLLAAEVVRATMKKL